MSDLGVWGLLKQYVAEFEQANHCQFSDAAWQRIKKLEADIYALMEAEMKLARADNKRLRKAIKKSEAGHE